MKLRPDRDLQVYFQQPTAVAALSETSETGFTVSGSWRQAFDWAVVEWSRDNVFEHPSLRNLPDGDLSGLQLSYEETRTNCIPMDSTTFDSVGWSYLRVWEESGGAENFHWVPLRQYATAIEGDTVQPTATFELQGTPTVGDYVELSWLDQHANFLMTSSDTLETAAAGLAGFINAKGPAGLVTAVATGATIVLTYTGAPGSNGNRVGVYASVHGSGTEGWSPAWTLFQGGTSPSKWRVDLDFSNLTDKDSVHVVTTNVRRMRWTWAADFQFDPYARSEFSAAVTNWTPSGTNLGHSVAGPGSRRIENTGMSYTGTWVAEPGNYSGGSIHHTMHAGASAHCTYTAPSTHDLYVGTRYWDQGAQITVQVDGVTRTSPVMKRSLEDVLVRVPAGTFGAGTHTVTVTHTGIDGQDVYLDFVELAIPATSLPTYGAVPRTTLATDWDTNHSIAIPPERTAWLMDTLGFRGRANHYAGALWFYELYNPTLVYASATVTFEGAPEFGGTTSLTIAGTPINHTNYITDTAETIAKAFELLLTAGSSAVWARAEGAVLTVTARALGLAGNSIGFAASTGSSEFTATVSSASLAGGDDGKWLTDLAALPRMNRAARDWSRSYFLALKGYGIDATAAFSMELKDGDASLAAGIAQRYPDGPVILTTPALQTNFGPESTAFWRQAYLDMADLMVDAGLTPYLQLGEVQWWYFADSAGMPFYDDYTKSTFQSTYGHAIQTVASETANPTSYPQECAFLPALIGAFTDAVMAFVRASYADAKFEVLYPTDTNDTDLNRLINFPVASWTASRLACLKTENFTFTGDRNLNKAGQSIATAAAKGFPLSQSSHLIGISDPTWPWPKEHRMSAGLESVVLFALDQFCLVGYALPLARSARRSAFMG